MHKTCEVTRGIAPSTAPKSLTSTRSQRGCGFVGGARPGGQMPEPAGSSAPATRSVPSTAGCPCRGYRGFSGARMAGYTCGRVSATRVLRRQGAPRAPPPAGGDARFGAEAHTPTHTGRHRGKRGARGARQGLLAVARACTPASLPPTRGAGSPRGREGGSAFAATLEEQRLRYALLGTPPEEETRMCGQKLSGESQLAMQLLPRTFRK